MPEEKLKELYNVCSKFIEKQNITCPEVVYQSDRVIYNAYEFIEKICDIIGYVKDEEN